ncbi:MAG TPA: PqqD family protein [Thermoanaerobaculia bacterium]|nr:PqqD family protein [Thermoanaerobaculia bacterium]
MADGPNSQVTYHNETETHSNSDSSTSEEGGTNPCLPSHVRGRARGAASPGIVHVDLDWRSCEIGAERLAALLLQSYGREQLREASYLAIPRGGLIVLGMLSYFLDLPHDALWRGAGVPNRLLVLVDDCALGGVRLRRALEISQAPEVVVAMLASPEGLREAVLAREPRVRRFLSAITLRLLPAAATVTTKAMLEAEAKLLSERYWLGRAVLPRFPWGEPDFVGWSEESQRFEVALRTRPPHASWKSRSLLGVPPLLERRGEWHAPEGVTWGEVDGVLWLCDTRGEGTVSSLDPPGSDIWRSLAAGADVDQTVAMLVDRFDVEPERVRQDVIAFAAELEARRMLERGG